MDMHLRIRNLFREELKMPRRNDHNDYHHCENCGSEWPGGSDWDERPEEPYKPCKPKKKPGESDWPELFMCPPGPTGSPGPQGEPGPTGPRPDLSDIESRLAKMELDIADILTRING